MNDKEKATEMDTPKEIENSKFAVFGAEISLGDHNIDGILEDDISAARSHITEEVLEDLDEMEI